MKLLLSCLLFATSLVCISSEDSTPENRGMPPGLTDRSPALWGSFCIANFGESDLSSLTNDDNLELVLTVYNSLRDRLLELSDNIRNGAADLKLNAAERKSLEDKLGQLLKEKTLSLPAGWRKSVAITCQTQKGLTKLMLSDIQGAKWTQEVSRDDEEDVAVEAASDTALFLSTNRVVCRFVLPVKTLLQTAGTSEFQFGVEAQGLSKEIASYSCRIGKGDSKARAYTDMKQAARNNDWTKAEKLALEVLAKCPESDLRTIYECNVILAQCAEAKGDYKKAIEHAEKAFTHARKNPRFETDYIQIFLSKLKAKTGK